MLHSTARTMRPLAAGRRPVPTVNGFTLLAFILLAIGIVVAYRYGTLRARREMRTDAPLKPAIVGLPGAPAVELPAESTPPSPPEPVAPTAALAQTHDDRLAAERFRLVLGLEAETAALRRVAVGREAELAQLREFAEERRGLYRELAAARGDTARYRQLIVDLEDNALPPLLDGPGSPDDLKLIVGVGPVLERMLQQLGISTYRQIARWSERDIDDFDARLPEFHGRIRRDEWVTQARELHQSKYGEPPQ